MDDTTPLIELGGICYTYPGNTVPALDHLDFTVRPGDRAGLVGHNGSGKTTLFHLIMGLIRPSTGILRIFGKARITEKDFVPVRREIGLLFQDSDDQLFCPTVLDDVAFGPLNMGKSRAEARDIALKTLANLGLKQYENRVTHTLSGGEKRMVALATILSMAPRLLLLDEPTTGLDPATRERLITLLNRMDTSMLIISHDPDFLSRTIRERYVMATGRLMAN